MSTSEPLIDRRFAKRLVIVCGLVPAALLVWDGSHDQLGVNHVNFAIRTTGLIGLVLLVLSLVITPLRQMTGWSVLIAVRRNLGVLACLYLATHFAIFFWFDRQASVASTLSEIATRRYLWFGSSSLALMIPLTVTSTDSMLSWMGPTRWKALHRLTYAIAIGAVLHYYLLVKSDVRQPLAFAGVVAVLLGYRFVNYYVGLQRKVAAATTSVGGVGLQKTTPRGFWSGELAIARIFQETHDVKTFRFVAVDGGPLPFTYTAGQYVNLALTIDGIRVNRSYTIASAPTRNGYCEISVKHTVNGFGSRHLHETWREGQRVKASAPAGRFVFAGHEAHHVLLIAGGIGITPMMSVIRSLTDRGWRGDISLLFSVRAVRDIVFRDELASLESRFPNLRVRVVVSADTETPWQGERGFITREIVTDFMPTLTNVRVMLCGPPPMMTAMRDIVVGLGVPDEDVHQEVFVSHPAVEAGGAATISTDRDEPLPDGQVASITFTRSGRTADIRPGQTVLEAAEDAGVDIPFECRSGICGQCRTQLVSGRVAMDVEDALTSSDRERGFILACQAHVLRDVEVNA